jgi:hypothetical protein
MDLASNERYMRKSIVKNDKIL